MDIKTTQLPHDIQYCLDGAIEYGDIDAVTYDIIQLYADRKLITDLHDNDHSEFYRSRMQYCRELTEIADGIFPRLTDTIKGNLLFFGIKGYHHRLADLAETLAHWAISDQTTGGALENFLDRPRLTRDGLPTKKVLRKVHSKKFIKKYVENNPEANHAKFIARRLNFWYDSIDPNLVKDGSEIRDLLDEQRKAYAVRLRERYDYEKLFPIKNKKITKYDLKKKRKILRRSLEFAIAVLGLERVKTFLKGEPIFIIGNRIGFRLERAFSINAIGHGAVNIWLVDKDRTELAELCVYFKSTPVLDQLAALALHVENDDGKEIIETANVIRFTDAGFYHPLLEERAKKDRENIQSNLNSFRSFDVRHEQEKIRNGKYWIETREIWLDRLNIFTFGGRNYEFAPYEFREKLPDGTYA